MAGATRQALLIGNAKYTDTALQSLAGAQVDIDAVGAALADPEIGNYHVEICVDEPAHQLQRHIERFFARAPSDSQLLLYITGHGVKDRNGRLYFAARDTDSSMLLSTGLPAAFVQHASEHSRCRKQIFIFDTCFAGAFARGYVHKSGGKVHANDAFGGSGKIVITASDDIQYALVENEAQGTGASSVFTRHLVETLCSGAAANDDGEVTADNLYRVTFEKVVQQNIGQQPQMWTYGLKGDLVIARGPVKHRTPEDAFALIDESLPRLRLDAIGALEALLLSDALQRPAIDTALERLINDDSRLVSGRAQEMRTRLREEDARAEKQREHEARAEEQRRIADEHRQRQDAETERNVEAARVATELRLAAEARRKVEFERERKKFADAMSRAAALQEERGAKQRAALAIKEPSPAYREEFERLAAHSRAAKGWAGHSGHIRTSAASNPPLAWMAWLKWPAFALVAAIPFFPAPPIGTTSQIPKPKADPALQVPIPKADDAAPAASSVRRVRPIVELPRSKPYRFNDDKP